MEALQEPPFRRAKQESEIKIDLSGVSSSAVEMSNVLVPKLPFEKFLGYLSLEDRVRYRLVSKGWYLMINNLKVTKLFYSGVRSGFIYEKIRLVSGAFAQNFICSPRIEWLQLFASSFLANLHHLRLTDFPLKPDNQPAVTQALESFGQLEKLEIIRLHHPRDDRDDESDYYLPDYSAQQIDLRLSLPTLKSIYLEKLPQIGRLTLKAPRLQNVELRSNLILDLTHIESVERLITTCPRWTGMKLLKNLRFLCFCDYENKIDSTLLSSLERLKVVFLRDPDNARELFKQKKQYGRADLEIYLQGLHLNGPDDPVFSAKIYTSVFYYNKIFNHWVEYQSKLADEIPLHRGLCYEQIASAPQESEINVLNRLRDLNLIIVYKPVEDIQRFLNFLQNFKQITELLFVENQPQELFDRLPNYCAVQKLTIDPDWLGYFGPVVPPDFEFLFRLKSLTHLKLGWPIDEELSRKLYEKLEFLLRISTPNR